MIKEANPATYEKEAEEPQMQQDDFPDFDAESLNGIMQSIAAFRE